MSSLNATLARGLPQARGAQVFANRRVPLPEPLRLTEIAVTVHDHIHPPQTPLTSTAGTASPISHTAPSSPVASVVEAAGMADPEEDLSLGEWQPVCHIYSEQGSTPCLHSKCQGGSIVLECTKNVELIAHYAGNC